MLARITEGLVIVRGDKRLIGTLIVTIIYNVFAWPFTSMIPVIGRDRLLLGPEAWHPCQPGRHRRVHRRVLLAVWLTPRWYARAYVGGVIAYMIMLIVFAVVTTPGVRGRGAVADRRGRRGFSTMQATLVYLAAPPEMRSRILGVLSVCIARDDRVCLARLAGGPDWRAQRDGGDRGDWAAGLGGDVAAVADDLSDRGYSAPRSKAPGADRARKRAPCRRTARRCGGQRVVGPVVFRMPLHADREARRGTGLRGDHAHRLDGAVGAMPSATRPGAS